MSIEVMTLVWRAELPAMDKIVLLRLADFADPQGRNVWPSVERVQKECGVSERHARAVIKKLTVDGLLVLVRQGGGRNRPTEYRFDLEALKRCTQCRVLDLENPAPGAEKGAPGAEKGAPGAPNPSVTTSNRQTAAVDACAGDAASPVGADPNATVDDQREKFQYQPATESNADLLSPGAVRRIADCQSPGDAVPQAGAVRDAHAVGRRVLEIMGVWNDPGWYGNYSRVHQWLADGADPEADIIPTVTRLMAKRSGDPPKSLRYFDAAIADAVRQRTAPMPTGGSHAINQRPRQDRAQHRNGFCALVAERAGLDPDQRPLDRGDGDQGRGVRGEAGAIDLDPADWRDA